ncbi:MAG TPA: clostripain-related cysteine peptidase, partial [Geobacteraceae bacterium]|nr:clostripain-related cysteine peptidase [Geobacteraceae bacterium]
SSTASAYPADHYALIIWNHGQGWKASGQSVNTKSIFTDVDNGTLVPLSNRLVKQALIDSGVALDILGIDACEMAVLEAAYEFRNVADILVSSQELVSSYGWDYDDLLGRLVKDPAMTPPELAQAMVASFKQYYVAGAYKDQTISALSLSSKYSSDGVGDITSVASSVNSMALDFMGRMTDSGTRAEILALLTSSRDTVQELDIIVQPATYIDLVDFARLAYGADSAVETAFNKILLAEYHGTSRPNAHGISIVFYDRTSIYDDYVYDTNYRDYNPSTGTGSLIEFLNQYNWDDMLHMYYGYQYPGKPN